MLYRDAAWDSDAAEDIDGCSGSAACFPDVHILLIGWQTATKRNKQTTNQADRGGRKTTGYEALFMGKSRRYCLFSIILLYCYDNRNMALCKIKQYQSKTGSVNNQREFRSEDIYL